MRPVLLRIPFSHFCRKAEWGLTQAGIPYDALDVKLTQMRRVPELSNAGTVPILKVGGRLLEDSHDILVWADEHRAPGTYPLYPERLTLEVADWEAWAGHTIAPAVRREAYRTVHEDWRTLWRYPETPWYLRTPLASRYALGVLKFYKARRYEQEDPATVRQAIDRVAQQLTASESTHLVGSEPTAADLSVAALLEPLLAIAGRRGYAGHPGWSQVEAFIRRVRPTTTQRRKVRRVHGRDWRAWAPLGSAALRGSEPL